MEYKPERTLEYAPGMLDKYIGYAEIALGDKMMAPAKIKLTRERLPVYFDLAIENGEAVDDVKVAHVCDLISKLNAIDVDVLTEKLRTVGQKQESS